MKEESKKILKLLEDELPRTAPEVADELFKDLARVMILLSTMQGRRYVQEVGSIKGEGLDTHRKYRITGRGKRFIAKHPGIRYW